MNFRDFYSNKTFLANIALLVVIVLVLFIVLNIFLRSFTHHGESLTVPDFKGMTIEEVEKLCDERNLRFKVTDSIFVLGVPFFTVVEQSPGPPFKVKKNRTIYLKISSNNPPKVKLPDLIDETLRRASVLLESQGLKTGDLSYIPGIAENRVVRVMKNGKLLEAGSLVPKGSVIDLVMEDGYTNSKVEVQDLDGLTIEEATFTLSGFGLNLGATVFDGSVKDTSRALIYKQRPKADPDKLIPQGESIDVWLTSPEKYKEKYAKKEEE